MPPVRSEPPAVTKLKRTGVCIAFVLVIFTVGSIILYNHAKKDHAAVPHKIIIPEWDVSEDLPLPVINATKTKSAPVAKVLAKPTKNNVVKLVTPACKDPEWCIPMPKDSLLRFKPPNDAVRWKQACVDAMNGEQVLLRQTIKVFPNFMDFLDGDISFRKWNNAADIFIDKRSDLSFLKNPMKVVKRRLADFEWEGQGFPVLPPKYETAEWERAPVLKMGYFAFRKEKNNYFEGNQIGEAILDLSHFLDKWKEVKNEIKTPFIVLHGSNENWGWLSTYFPNRTIAWGKCCEDVEKDLLDFLNHDMTLMMLIEQHSNFTHPKLVTFPRGLPLPQNHVNRQVWDTMRLAEKKFPKNQLVFTASSKWGSRPQIIDCVSKKFKKEEFLGVGYTASQAGRIEPTEYYMRLARTRTGLALSGLGADTYRLWELMTLGSLAVIERGMGLDKMVWKLPVLIVDDYDVVTPQLLRRAYIEAIYHAEDFEFEKLTQSWWFSFIGNVSRTMTTQTVLDRFPPHADETAFTRPREPFDCWKTNSCGKGTKRIPKSSC